jgi:hypothetical protein
MSKPQSPELRRSGTTDLDPDSIGSARQAEHDVGTSGPTGPVPEDNRPGHHPDHDQDQPPLDDFAARFGTQAHHEGEPAGPASGRDPDAVVDRATARAGRLADEALEESGLTADPGAGDLAGEGLAILARAGRWSLAVARYGLRSIGQLLPARR